MSVDPHPPPDTRLQFEMRSQNLREELVLDSCASHDALLRYCSSKVGKGHLLSESSICNKVLQCFLSLAQECVTVTFNNHDICNVYMVCITLLYMHILHVINHFNFTKIIRHVRDEASN